MYLNVYWDNVCEARNFLEPHPQINCFIKIKIHISLLFLEKKKRVINCNSGNYENLLGTVMCVKFIDLRHMAVKETQLNTEFNKICLFIIRLHLTCILTADKKFNIKLFVTIKNLVISWWLHFIYIYFHFFTAF